MKKFIFILILALLLTMTACGAKEETTLSGMIVSVEGTVITLMEMDGTMERPQMPEGMEGFEGFEGFNPENMPEDFNTENMPEGFNPGNMPEGFDPENMPEGMSRPEGMPEFDGEVGERPEFSGEQGERPSFGGEGDRMPGGFGNFSEMETKTLDIGKAHISVEIENGKESGSMDNIVPGAFVTITVNGKGEATYVLVSAQSGFGGRGSWGGKD